MRRKHHTSSRRDGQNGRVVSFWIGITRSLGESAPARIRAAAGRHAFRCPFASCNVPEALPVSLTRACEKPQTKIGQKNSFHQFLTYTEHDLAGACEKPTIGGGEIVGPLGREGRLLYILVFQGCALRWVNDWAFGPKISHQQSMPCLRWVNDWAFGPKISHRQSMPCLRWMNDWAFGPKISHRQSMPCLRWVNDWAFGPKISHRQSMPCLRWMNDWAFGPKISHQQSMPCLRWVNDWAFGPKISHQQSMPCL